MVLNPIKQVEQVTAQTGEQSEDRWANEILKDFKYQNNEVGILVWA